MGGSSYQSEVSSGSVGGSAQTVASKHGCPGSGSRGADGGKKLLQRLVAEIQGRQPTAVSPPEPVGLGNLVSSYLSGQHTLGPQTRQRPIRRDWNGVVCFSCGKSGHAATRCPALDESFPFMLPGWRAESTPGGFIMISPRVAAERRRTENCD